MHKVVDIVAVHLYLVAVELYGVQNPKGVLQSQARLMNMPCRAALLHAQHVCRNAGTAYIVLNVSLVAPAVPGIEENFRRHDLFSLGNNIYSWKNPARN